MTQSVKHEFLGLDRFGLVSPPYPVLETIRNRTAAMRAAYSGEKQFHAFDWAVSALTLTQGVHLRSRSIVLHRQGAERGKYSSEHLRSAPGWLDRLFPLARMPVALVRN